MLSRNHPQIVWVQLPQVPVLSTALLYRRIVKRDAIVIADCHNRILNPPWNRWPGLRRQLNACNVVVVHNAAVLPKLRKLGVDEERLCILEDPPALVRNVKAGRISFPRPWVLFLASFNPDEPISKLLEAAKLAPDIHFVIAGEPGRASGRHSLANCPSNVSAPGFLAGDDLEAAIYGADAVLALTKLQDAQLSSAAEAIGAGRPMVISDTPVTRELYYRGGIFVDTASPASIVTGCRQAISEADRLSAESVAMREERYLKWWSQAQCVLDRIPECQQQAANSP